MFRLGRGLHPWMARVFGLFIGSSCGYPIGASTFNLCPGGFAGPAGPQPAARALSEPWVRGLNLFLAGPPAPPNVFSLKALSTDIRILLC